jgi:hypothetical protein
VLSQKQTHGYDMDLGKLVFILMLSLYIVHEGFQFSGIKKERSFLRGYLLYIWSMENILDTLLIGSSILYLATHVYNRLFLMKINAQLMQMPAAAADFVSLHHMRQLESKLQSHCYFMILLAFLKALNLLKLNPKTYLITDTMRTSCADLTLFILFVFANYAFFGFIGFIMFHADDEAQFGTLGLSVYTSILSLVRHIEFERLVERQFVWLFMWQVILYFYAQRVLINFVIAVIIHYFDQVRLNHRKTKTERTFQRISANVLEYFHFSSNKVI